MEELTLELSKLKMQEINRIARKKSISIDNAINFMIDKGIRGEKIEEALALIRKNKITVWRASEIASISYREMLELMKDNNIPFPLTEDELKKEICEILES